MKQPYERHGLCDSTCKKCKYRMSFGMITACDYLNYAGTIRPCPAGKGCTVFESGESLNKIKACRIKPDKKKSKICKRCGKEFITESKKIYCDKYIKIKNKNCRAEYNRQIRAKRREVEFSKDKYCDFCGALYHSYIARTSSCDKCRNLSQSTREKLKVSKNGDNK